MHKSYIYVHISINILLGFVGDLTGREGRRNTYRSSNGYGSWIDNIVIGNPDRSAVKRRQEGFCE